MPSLFTISAASMACLAAMALAVPTNTNNARLSSRQSTSSSCTAPGRITVPTMYNLFPGSPDKSEPTTTYIDIRNLEIPSTPEQEQEQEQVAVFQGIPAGAKTCTLGWIQAAASEREFEVDQNGSTKVKPFYAFPPAPSTPPANPGCGGGAAGGGNSTAGGEPLVTYNTINPLSEASEAGPLSPDFTFWNDTPGAVPHTAGMVPCAEAIYLHVKINLGNGHGGVVFQQDEKNGWVLDYTC